MLRGSYRHFSNNPPKSNLEIEKKFVCTDDIHKTIQSFATNQTVINMVDTYYDTNNYELSCKDMWLRKRNKVFELKWPHNFGTKSEAFSTDMVVPFATDFYNESTDILEIASVVQNSCKERTVEPLGSVNGWNSWMSKTGISPFATIQSKRTRFNIAVPLHIQASKVGGSAHQQHVCVDIDEVIFYEGQPVTPEAQCMKGLYAIGEVELAPDTEEADHKEERQAAATQEDKLAVMAEVFRVLGISPQPVRGKVLEYLYRYRPRHYQALRDCGQLASKGL